VKTIAADAAPTLTGSREQGAGSGQFKSQKSRDPLPLLFPASCSLFPVFYPLFPAFMPCLRFAHRSNIAIMQFRDATRKDLDALLRLEEAAFDIDRLSRRSFQRFIQHRRSALRVAEEDGRLLGYLVVLFRRGTSLARLYSMAVDETARGRNLGKQLLEDGEQQAVENSCVAMRLEVREDNAAAIALYRSAGYEPFGRYPDYYEDHADALRMEKALTDSIPPPQSRVPWYGQTLDFTCGPAALMMAMASLDPKQRLDRSEEVRLWREATTVFMTSGHGGCGPFGLATAAGHRAHRVELWVNGPEPFFLESVRSEDKKAVITLVEADFRRELESLQVPVHRGWPGIDKLRERFEHAGHSAWPRRPATGRTGWSSG